MVPSPVIARIGTTPSYPIPRASPTESAHSPVIAFIFQESREFFPIIGIVLIEESDSCNIGIKRRRSSIERPERSP